MRRRKHNIKIDMKVYFYAEGLNRSSSLQIPVCWQPYSLYKVSCLIDVAEYLAQLSE